MNRRDCRKIFATVGTQLPFDRLLVALDEWAGRNPAVEVFAQTGSTATKFPNLQVCTSLDPETFRQHFMDADLIVAHAGMGTILQSMEWCKRLIIMPRRADLSEHRNDHQMATAAEVNGLGHVRVVANGDQLAEAIDAELYRTGARVDRIRPSAAHESVINAVKDFVGSPRQSSFGSLLGNRT